eukprot:6202256-Pleurochrysis_carterae.AAC.2
MTYVPHTRCHASAASIYGRLHAAGDGTDLLLPFPHALPPSFFSLSLSYSLSLSRARARACSLQLAACAYARACARSCSSTGIHSLSPALVLAPAPSLTSAHVSFPSRHEAPTTRKVHLRCIHTNFHLCLSEPQ